MIWHDFYDGSPLLALPMVAMFGFMITFAVAVVRAWKKGGNAPDGNLPLEDAPAATAPNTLQTLHAGSDA